MKTLTLFMLVLACSPIFAAESVCEPDADLSGMVEALRATGTESGSDAAIVIEGYQAERAALCSRLGAQAEIVSGLREQLTLMRELADGQREDAREYREIITEATRASLPSRLSTGWVAGGGLCKTGGGETDLCVGIMWGLRF